jgi:D-inositol-3-phosphate glycosyltransferase
MTPPRIALVSEHASPLAALGGVDAGGQNVHVAALAVHLADLGHDVTVHTRRDVACLPDVVEVSPRVRVHHVDAGPAKPIPKDDLFPHMRTFADELERAWLAEPPDLVHTHFWMSGWAGVRAARRSRIPVAHTFHALGVVKRRHLGVRDTSPAERDAVERRLLGCVDHVVATCSDEVFELRQLGVEAPVSIVPCGVDTRAFAPTGTVEARDPRSPTHRVVVVGRLVERKGVADVIAALAEVPDTELVVAGGPPPGLVDSDPDVAVLRAAAVRCGVVDRVDLRGRMGRSELPALLRSADLVVCAPWYEPFGIVPLEAMACGVPVVASAVGGLVDSVVDGVTGAHVPPRHPAVLAAAMRKLLADPAARRAMGRAGLARVRGRFTWDRVATATAEVYEEVLAARRAPAARAAAGR